MPTVKCKRVYDPVEAADGYRVLADRLWPRGISRVKAALDLWAKDVAPSNELRQWYGHRDERWAEFQRRYKDELKQQPGADALSQLRAIARRRNVTLLTATRAEFRSHLIVLQALLG